MIHNICLELYIQYYYTSRIKLLSVFMLLIKLAHLNLFLLLQVLDFVVPMKLIVSLVDIGTFPVFFSECINFLFLFLFEIYGIIAKINESLCPLNVESSRLNYFCLDSLTKTLSSKYPTRGFYPLTLKIPCLVKNITTFSVR